MKLKRKLTKATGSAQKARSGSYFKLSGDVGGRVTFDLPLGSTRQLQIISVSLPANSSLIISHVRFFFRDPEVNLRISVLDLGINEIRHWLAPTSAGELRPNVTLINTTRARNIYLAIAGTSIRTGSGATQLHPSDGWWVKFSIVPRR